jgi:hypothetical protein
VRDVTILTLGFLVVAGTLAQQIRAEADPSLDDSTSLARRSLVEFPTPGEIAARIPPPSAAEIAQPRPARVFDDKFAGLAAASVVATAMDVALARRCIDAHTCREANPLMGGSAAIPVGFGVAVADNLIAYEARKRHARFWYLPQAATIAWHAVGIASDVRASQ